MSKKDRMQFHHNPHPFISAISEFARFDKCFNNKNVHIAAGEAEGCIPSKSQDENLLYF